MQSNSETLVFVHGYLGGSKQWQDQVARFSSEFNVVTPDLPGFGLNNAAEAPESIEEFSHFVLNNLSERGIDHFHLVGHSMGGMIAQQMVAQQPERILQLVLYGTGPMGVMPGRFETVDVSRRRLISDGVLSTGKRISSTWFMHGTEADGYRTCADLAAFATEQSALAGLTAMEKWSGVDALKNIRSRTLVLWGDSDRTYLWSQPELLWQKISNAQLAVLPGCSHAMHLEKPALFNSILSDFLLD